MRLFGTKTEKSHFFYLIINQVFKPIFSIKNETLRLFLQKTFSRKKESLPYKQVQKLKELKKLSLPTVVREVKRQLSSSIKLRTFVPLTSS